MTGSIAPNRPCHHGTVVARTVGTVAISCNVPVTIPVNIQPSQIRRFQAVHFWGFFRGTLFSSNPGHQGTG